MLFQSPYAEVTIPDKPLSHFVLERMAAYGDKPALIDGPTDRTITYRQLSGAVRLAAAGLSQRGFGKGDVFAIYSPNLPEYAIIFHAVILLGGTVTTLNPLYTVDEVVYQLNDAGASYLLTISHFLPNAQAAAAHCPIKEIFTLDPAEGATPFAALLDSDGIVPEVTINTAEDIAVLPYSSGTTGLPKGVMLTHRNIVANIVQCEGIVGADLISSDDRLMGVLPFFHIFGMVVILNISLVRGATIVTMPRFDFEQFLGLVQKHKITRVNVVPPILVNLVKNPLVEQYDTSSLIELASGAAPLSAELAGAVMERIGCRVIQGFGMTETSPVTHYYNQSLAGSVKPSSVGPLIPNTEALIVDVASYQPVGVNEQGELWIRGPQVMAGYLHNPKATSLTLDREGWLHTGDIGYADEEGFFFIMDRLKELIKYKGYQVAPAELESLLLSHPAVADAAVIPSPDEEAGEVPKAFIVRKSDAVVTAEELLAWTAERLPPYKKIRRLEFIEAIPKSLTGKILRRELLEREREAASVKKRK